LRSIAAQNTSHAFPYAAYSGYKKLNELSFLNGNSMSYFHAYMDLKYEREMPFDHLPGLFSYAVYTAEITEMPEEVYPSYYMVKMGDNVLIDGHPNQERAGKM
jgi:hypothetical protein